MRLAEGAVGEQQVGRRELAGCVDAAGGARGGERETGARRGLMLKAAASQRPSRTGPMRRAARMAMTSKRKETWIRKERVGKRCGKKKAMEPDNKGRKGGGKKM